MDKIYVTRAAMPDIEEYIDEIRDIWDTHWMTNMGKKHETLRKLLIEYLNTDNLELLVNGHMSLELTFQAFNLKGEVITSPYTFASTIHAIVRNGLKPILCDINSDDYTIDVSKIEELITDKTCAILPVHVYGNICDVEKIKELAKKYNLKVIYDAAHAFGETYKGEGVANFGDASCFSFHATKVFNTIEGGAVCYRDKKTGEDIYMLKNFGISGPESVDGVGANAKLNEFCAAMGICNLRHIDDNIEKRKIIAECYDSLLGDIDGIRLNGVNKDIKRNYSYYPVVFEKNKGERGRDYIFNKLEENNIYARKYFYPIANEYGCYAGNEELKKYKTPVAKYISENIITLPIYPDLDIDIVEKICDIIKKNY